MSIPTPYAIHLSCEGKTGKQYFWIKKKFAHSHMWWGNHHYHPLMRESLIYPLHVKRTLYSYCSIILFLRFTPSREGKASVLPILPLWFMIHPSCEGKTLSIYAGFQNQNSRYANCTNRISSPLVCTSLIQMCIGQIVVQSDFNLISICVNHTHPWVC